MARHAHSHSPPSPERTHRLGLARLRRERLRHIQRLPDARRIGLVRITRATRPAKPNSQTGLVEASLRDQMLGFLPSMRAFARSLTRDATRADDLVQDAFLRAWASIDRFERGTNLEAWLFTILRNGFYTEYRKRRFEVEDPDGAYAQRLIVLPDQDTVLDLKDLRRALDHLPREQREALLLVGADGLSYDDAAIRCGSPVGTIKSRVNRARTQLVALLHLENRHEIGPDRVMRAALHEPTDLGQ